MKRATKPQIKSGNVLLKPAASKSAITAAVPAGAEDFEKALDAEKSLLVIDQQAAQQLSPVVKKTPAEIIAEKNTRLKDAKDTHWYKDTKFIDQAKTTVKGILSEYVYKRAQSEGLEFHKTKDKFFDYLDSIDNLGLSNFTVILMCFVSDRVDPKDNYQFLEKVGDATLKSCFVKELFIRDAKYGYNLDEAGITVYGSKYLSEEKLSEASMKLNLPAVAKTHIDITKPGKPLIKLAEDIFESLIGGLLMTGEKFKTGYGWVLCDLYTRSIIDDILKIEFSQVALKNAQPTVTKVKEIYDIFGPKNQKELNSSYVDDYDKKIMYFVLRSEMAKRLKDFVYKSFGPSLENCIVAKYAYTDADINKKESLAKKVMEKFEQLGFTEEGVIIFQLTRDIENIRHDKDIVDPEKNNLQQSINAKVLDRKAFSIKIRSSKDEDSNFYTVQEVFKMDNSNVSINRYIYRAVDIDEMYYTDKTRNQVKFDLMKAYLAL